MNRVTFALLTALGIIWAGALLPAPEVFAACCTPSCNTGCSCGCSGNVGTIPTTAFSDSNCTIPLNPTAPNTVNCISGSSAGCTAALGSSSNQYLDKTLPSPKFYAPTYYPPAPCTTPGDICLANGSCCTPTWGACGGCSTCAAGGCIGTQTQSCTGATQPCTVPPTLCPANETCSGSTCICTYTNCAGTCCPSGDTSCSGSTCTVGNCTGGCDMPYLVAPDLGNNQVNNQSFEVCAPAGVNIVLSSLYPGGSIYNGQDCADPEAVYVAGSTCAVVLQYQSTSGCSNPSTCASWMTPICNEDYDYYWNPTSTQNCSVCPTNNYWNGSTCAGVNTCYNEYDQPYSCACPSTYNFNGSACACPYGATPSGGVCACLGGATMVESNSYWSCACGVGQYDTGSGCASKNTCYDQYDVPYACDCPYGENFVGTSCVCAPNSNAACACYGGATMVNESNSYYNFYICECPQNEYWNGSSCQWINTCYDQYDNPEDCYCPGTEYFNGTICTS